MSRRKNSWAFTLIEMLVVIVVIMILAGIVLSVVRGAKGKAEAANCKSNLRQLQAAAMAYCINNANGKLPAASSAENYQYYPAPNRSEWHQSTWGWVDWVMYRDNHNPNNGTPSPGRTPWWGSSGVQSVVKGTLWEWTGRNPKVYVCPSFTKMSFWNNNPRDPTNGVVSVDPPGKWYKGEKTSDILSLTNVNPIARTYAMNSSVSESDIGYIESSKRLLFADMAHTNWYGGQQICTNYMRLPNPAGSNGWNGALGGVNVPGKNYASESVGTVHDGQACGVFVDGHIEMIPWNRTTNACQGLW